MCRGNEIEIGGPTWCGGGGSAVRTAAAGWWPSGRYIGLGMPLVPCAMKYWPRATPTSDRHRATRTATFILFAATNECAQRWIGFIKYSALIGSYYKMTSLRTGKRWQQQFQWQRDARTTEYLVNVGLLGKIETNLY